MLPKLIGYAFGEGFAKDAFPLWMVPVVLIGLYVVRGLCTSPDSKFFTGPLHAACWTSALRWWRRC